MQPVLDLPYPNSVHVLGMEKPSVAVASESRELSIALPWYEPPVFLAQTVISHDLQTSVIPGAQGRTGRGRPE